jgi:hypothetical protein
MEQSGILCSQGHIHCTMYAYTTFVFCKSSSMLVVLVGLLTLTTAIVYIHSGLNMQKLVHFNSAKTFKILCFFYVYKSICSFDPLKIASDSFFGQDI